VEEMRAETDDEDYQFIAVHLPHGEQIDADDVDDAMEWMQPDRMMSANIQPAVDAIVEELETNDMAISDFNKGNIKARQRMVAQYAIAGDLAGVVLGTDHPAEAVTGFYTKFGDGAADLTPLYRLNKRQGKQLLQALDSPAEFYEKAPTADLRDDEPGLTDEEELGVSYDHIDDYLEGKDVPKDAKEIIEKHYLNSQHKRHAPINVFHDFWKNGGDKA